MYVKNHTVLNNNMMLVQRQYNRDSRNHKAI